MINIRYYNAKGYLYARVTLDGVRVCDMGMGIKISKSFNYNTKRFSGDRELNFKLSSFEVDVNAKYKEVCALCVNNPIPDGVLARYLKGAAVITEIAKKATPLTLTLSWMTDEYERRSKEGTIYNKRTGIPLSEESLKTNIQCARLLKEYLRKYPDFNFSRYNISTFPIIGEAQVREQYSDMIHSLKKYLFSLGQDASSTIPRNLIRIKNMITYFADNYALSLGDLLADMKMCVVEKDVITLSNAQVDFILENYKSMREECTSLSQKHALDYWYVALILNPRRKDMSVWTPDNLMTDSDGVVWIKYHPHKNKNGNTVEAPVPATVAEIFRVNAERFGALLPPLDPNINRILKSVAARYEVFQNDIQVQENGEFKRVRLCDYIHIHMLRSSGISHKLMNEWSESFVKEMSGHTHDSRAFRRYVKIQPDAKLRVASAYFDKLRV
jgi:integrase